MLKNEKNSHDNIFFHNNMMIYLDLFFIFPLATNLSHNIYCWYEMNGIAIVYKHHVTYIGRSP
jgi:hypothetical protein